MTNAVSERARALVGTPFRPQGRRAEHGLDCIGLVALAADLPAAEVPSGYSLHTLIPEEVVSRTLAGRAARLPRDKAEEGDVLLVRAGPVQSHFVILEGSGFVHADMRLGKVVHRPGPVPWPVLGAWRILETG